MGGAVERLTKLVRSEDRFAIPYSELRQAQAEAMNERFEERGDRIKLLAFRAKEAGTTEIRGREDMVPLLFPHTAYKSYPESFLSEQKWDRLGKWLGTVSPYPICDDRDVGDQGHRRLDRPSRARRATTSPARAARPASRPC